MNAIDYVLKPFDKQRLARAIQRAKALLEAEPPRRSAWKHWSSKLGTRKGQPVKLLVKTQQRLLLVDAADMVFASIEDGTITVSTREVEGTSNYRTIEELAVSLDSDASGARTAPTS